MNEISLIYGAGIGSGVYLSEEIYYSKTSRAKKLKKFLLKMIGLLDTTNFKILQ